MSLYRIGASVSGDYVGAKKKAPKAKKAPKPKVKKTKVKVTTPKGQLSLVKNKKTGKKGLAGKPQAVAFARNNPAAMAAVIKQAKAKKKAKKAKRLSLKAVSAQSASPTSLVPPNAVPAEAPPVAPVPSPGIAPPVFSRSPEQMAASDDDWGSSDETETPESESEDSYSEDDSQSSEDEDSSPEDESSEDEGSEDEDPETENDQTSGEANMSREEYIGLEEIGLEEIGDDDEIGATNPRPNRVVVAKKKDRKARQQPIGFTGTALAAGSSETLTVTPQTLFRGRRLIVSSAIAANFTITDIKVGNQSQMASSGALPADAFLPTTTGEDNLTMDTCNPGIQISISVTNISGGASTFRAALFGNSVM